MIPGGEGQQLKLFMTGVELQDSLTDSIDRNPIGGFGRSMDDMWKIKLRQAKRPDTAMNHGAGVYKSIKDNGYVGRTDTPEGFSIMHRREYGGIPEWDKDHMSVDGGHHRIAAAADLERKGKRTVFIPTANNQWEYPTDRPPGR
jgi:hypothetical protein